VAFLGAHLLWMMSEHDMELLYDAVTINPAAAIGLNNHRLAIGDEANLVVVEGESIADALRFHAAPRAVVSHGRLVDQRAMRELAMAPA
jgi:cytosine deaminase